MSGWPPCAERPASAPCAAQQRSALSAVADRLNASLGAGATHTRHSRSALGLQECGQLQNRMAPFAVLPDVAQSALTLARQMLQRNPAHGRTT